MKVDIDIIEKDKTWKLVELSKGFISSQSNVHLEIAKRVLRYINGTINLGTWYLNSGRVKLDGYHVDMKEVKLDCYADSDWAGSIDDMNSTSGYVFTIAFGVIFWNAKEQEVVTQSTVDIEYISRAAATNEVI
ncbi:secreted RxLR effector protein 161-like [Apium graveolens]|uniref:secreted RxLR effector protein 161-like n=1 Tax=Apium graveolens TaxID=4045 RepID=UPI003D7B17C2